MRNKLLRHLQKTGLIPPNSHIVCALSGGADSVAMTHCLFSLQKELDFTLSACHFNHRLRGKESDGDEGFCRAFCADLGIDLTVGSADVLARAKETGESVEEAARNCRYAFFASLDGIIATAHTASDQAETVLLNLLRGTGLKGLGGIPQKRDAIIRPMLTVSREEILAYLRENRLSHREDGTNGEDSCLRNRLRHHVMPLLREENPAFLESVGQMTELLRQDEELLQTQADVLLRSIDGGWELAPLQSAPAPLRRRAIRTLLGGCRIPKLSAAHILLAEGVVLGDKPSAEVSLPLGWKFMRRYDTIHLCREDAYSSFSPVTLPCPGSVEIPQLGLIFTAAFEAQAPITIRPRKEGDRIRLAGGTKSVKKLLIDQKIPAKRRDSIPILEREGVILSVWGVADSVNFADKTAVSTEIKRGD